MSWRNIISVSRYEIHLFLKCQRGRSECKSSYDLKYSPCFYLFAFFTIIFATGGKFPFFFHRRSLGKIRKPILSLSLTSADHANARKQLTSTAKTKKVIEKNAFFRQKIVKAYFLLQDHLPGDDNRMSLASFSLDERLWGQFSSDGKSNYRFKVKLLLTCEPIYIWKEDNLFSLEVFNKWRHSQGW